MGSYGSSSSSAAAAVGAVVVGMSGKGTAKGIGAADGAAGSSSVAGVSGLSQEQQQAEGLGRVEPAAAGTGADFSICDDGSSDDRPQQLLLRANLAPPSPVGCCLLLRRPWVLLLRMLLQLGISIQSLLYISSPPGA
jgi:hypothetical protein